MRKPRTLAFTLKKRVLVYIRVYPGITSKDISVALGAKWASVQNIIVIHCKEGLVKQVSMVDGVKGWAVADYQPKVKRVRSVPATIPKQNIFSALGL